MAELSQEERESVALIAANRFINRLARNDIFDDIADELPVHSTAEVARIHAIIVNRAQVILGE